MKVELNVTSAEDYFNEEDREIDWDGLDKEKVSYEQADDLIKIKRTSYELYTNIMILTLSANTKPSKINFTVLLNDIVNDYERIFPETLKDE